MVLVEIAKPDLPIFDQFRAEYPQAIEVVETDQFNGLRAILESSD